MCYSINVKVKKEEIVKKFPFANAKDFLFKEENTISGFGLPELSILIRKKESDSYGFETYNWGLLPEWVKEENAPKHAIKTLNARLENITETPSFARYIDTQRAILPIAGFYEWQHIGEEKIQYHIQALEGIMGLAVVYNLFEKKGKMLKTFSIITLKANALMSEIHNTKKRMPLIIPNGFEKAWLGEKSFSETIKNLPIVGENFLFAEKTEPNTLNNQIKLF